MRSIAAAYALLILGACNGASSTRRRHDQSTESVRQQGPGFAAEAGRAGRQKRPVRRWFRQSAESGWRPERNAQRKQEPLIDSQPAFMKLRDCGASFMG